MSAYYIIPEWKSKMSGQSYVAIVLAVNIVGEKDWEKSRITMLYRTPVGQGITLSREEYESYHYTFTPTSLDTNMSVPDYIRD